MVTIDLTGKVLTNLDGSPLPNEIGGGESKVALMAQYLGRMLSESEVGDPMKLDEMGRRIYKESVLEVDTADYDLIEKAVVTAKRFFPVVKGPILQELRTARLASQAKKK